mmetsp:Transcript_848/g.1142  ORF Transcript_848/g.1142 Transcript_848/m.1142 type:complete len:91 (-) Transcript_848:94-366(-)
MGDHCEIVQSLEMAEPSYSSSNHHPVTIFMVIVVVASVLVVSGIVVRKKLVKRANDKEEKNPDQFTKDFERTPPKTYISEDEEMENIEII